MPDFEMFCFQLECFKKGITFALPLEIVYHSLYYSLQKRGISHTVQEKSWPGFEPTIVPLDTFRCYSIISLQDKFCPKD